MDQVVLIKEVNPQAGTVSAETLNGATMVMGLASMPPMAAVPVTGEVWITEQRESGWNLIRKIETGHEQTPIDKLGPGDIRVEAPGNVHINGESIIVNGQVLNVKDTPASEIGQVNVWTGEQFEPRFPVVIRKNSEDVGEQRNINLVEGTNIVLDVTEQDEDEEIRVILSLPTQITSEGFLRITDGSSTYSVNTVQFTGAVVSESPADTAVVNIFPAGLVLPTAAQVAPTGWLFCDGSQVSRTTFAALFTAIGTAYGVGNGSTTFNLPNTKGRTLVGFDPAQAEFLGMGQSGGEKSHLLSIPELPNHAHAIVSDGVHNHTAAAPTSTTIVNPWDGVGGTVMVFNASSSQPTSSAGSHNHGSATTPVGSSTAHNNLQPYIVVNHIIKT